MSTEKKFEKDLPSNFPADSVDTIKRITAHQNVVGVMFFRQKHMLFSTLPESIIPALSTKLPALNHMFHRALAEIDPLDEFIAYRIESRTTEIIVTGDKDMGACVVQHVRKYKRTKKVTDKRNSKKKEEEGTRKT